MKTKKLNVKIVNSLLKEAKAKFPTGNFFKDYNDRDKTWIIYTRNLDLYNSEQFEDYIENIIDSPYDEVCFLYSSTEKLAVKSLNKSLFPNIVNFEFKLKQSGKLEAESCGLKELCLG